MSVSSRQMPSQWNRQTPPCGRSCSALVRNSVSGALDYQVSGRCRPQPNHCYRNPPARTKHRFSFVGLEGVPDSEVLEQAARDGRILISHDRRTMPVHFRGRLESGKPSPGVLIVPQHAALGPVVDAIVLIWAASEPDEWRNQIYYL